MPEPFHVQAGGGFDAGVNDLRITGQSRGLSLDPGRDQLTEEERGGHEKGDDRFAR